MIFSSKCNNKITFADSGANEKPGETEEEAVGTRGRRQTVRKEYCDKPYGYHDDGRVRIAKKEDTTDKTV